MWRSLRVRVKELFVDVLADPSAGNRAGDTDLLRCLFLERLQRLATIRADPSSCTEAPSRHLLDQATYSTYRDCVELGLGPMARKILGLPEDRGAA